MDDSLVSGFFKRKRQMIFENNNNNNVQNANIRTKTAILFLEVQCARQVEVFLIRDS
jgi:hypothetical protein